MAKKAPAHARPQSSFPWIPVSLFAALWLGILLWNSKIHFPWQWNSVSLLFIWHRFGTFSWSTWLTQWMTVCKHMCLLAAYMIATQSAGHFIITKYFTRPRSRLETVLYSFGAGLTALVLVMFAIAACHVLYAGVIAAVMGVGTVWGAWYIWQRRSFYLPGKGWLLGKLTWPDAFLFVAVAGFLWLVAMMVQTPEIFFDSLVYHLAVPSHWIKHHGFAAMPTLFFSNLPMSIELIYAGILTIADERLARLFHASLGLLGALSIFAVGRRYFSKRTGLWALGIFLTTPVVVMNLLVAGVDVGATFFTVLSTAVLLEWLEDKSGGASRLPYLAGVFAGLAVACKYNTAFTLAPVIVVAVSFKYASSRAWKAWLQTMLKIGAVAFCLVLPWFVKNVVYTGNPVYPFLYKIIPSKNIHPNKMQQQMDGFKEYGQRTWLQYLRQPWDLSFFQPTSNSYIGVVYLFLLPGLVCVVIWWRRGPPQVIKVLLLASLLAAVIWSFQTRITRYLIPTLPLVCLLGAWIITRAMQWNRVLGTLLQIGVGMLALWGLAMTYSIAMPHWDPVGVFLGLESRDAYLDRKLMNSYTAMAREINTLPEHSKILIVGETRSYYIKRETIAASVYDYNPFLEAIAHAKDAKSVWQSWNKQGITHVFVHAQEASRTRGYEPYVWDDGAIARYQELFSHYLKPQFTIQQQVLYKVLEQPDMETRIRAGRPLFTYPRETVNKVIQHFGRVQLAARQNRFEDIRAIYMRMTELVPQWYVPYVNLGWFYFQRKMDDASFEMFRQADKLAQLDPGTYNNLGIQYMERGFLEQARMCFTKALELKPDLDVARKNLEIIENTRKRILQ